MKLLIERVNEIEELKNNFNEMESRLIKDINKRIKEYTFSGGHKRTEIYFDRICFYFDNCTTLDNPTMDILMEDFNGESYEIYMKSETELQVTILLDKNSKTKEEASKC